MNGFYIGAFVCIAIICIAIIVQQSLDREKGNYVAGCAFFCIFVGLVCIFLFWGGYSKNYYEAHPEEAAQMQREIEAERAQEEIERASKEFEQQMYNIERDKQEREYKHMQELERNYQRSRR